MSDRDLLLFFLSLSLRKMIITIIALMAKMASSFFSFLMRKKTNPIDYPHTRQGAKSERRNCRRLTPNLVFAQLPLCVLSPFLSRRSRNSIITFLLSPGPISLCLPIHQYRLGAILMDHTRACVFLSSQL